MPRSKPHKIPTFFPLDASSKRRFTDALHKGQGRAMLHVIEHGAKGLEDVILDGCVNNRAYDPQVEGSRAQWMHSMIERTPQRKWFRRGILDAARDLEEVDYSTPIAEMLMLYAKAGDEKARQALYDHLKKFGAPDWNGASEIIELDGIDGLLFVASVMGRDVNDENFWCAPDIAGHAIETFGRKSVDSALRQRAATDDAVATFQRVRYNHQRRKQAASLPRRQLSFEYALELIDAPVHNPRPLLWRYGLSAPSIEIERIYHRYLADEDATKRSRYLSVFSGRGVPWFEPALLEDLQSDDYHTSWAARRTLSHVRHPAVRNAALMELERSSPMERENALILLTANYADCDERIVYESVCHLRSPYRLHDVGNVLNSIAESNPTLELTFTLSWIYHRTPCEYCRRLALTGLVQRGSAPEWMLKEALWDSEDETRALAAATLRLPSRPVL